MVVLALLVVIAVAATMPLTEVASLSIAGILIGGAMAVASLSSRCALDELHAWRGEYEAAPALGFLPRDAALEVCRPTPGQALVPAMDKADPLPRRTPVWRSARLESLKKLIDAMLQADLVAPRKQRHTGRRGPGPAGRLSPRRGEGLAGAPVWKRSTRSST